jgi:hypothetical protein
MGSFFKPELENSFVFACNGDVAVHFLKTALVLLYFLDQAIGNHIVDAILNPGRVLSKNEFVVGKLQLPRTILEFLFVYCIRAFNLFATD